MTKKEFLNKLGNSDTDIIQKFLELIRKGDVGYCVIGGLAVNAYVEPVVSLDLDIVVTVSDVDKLIKSAGKIFKIKKYAHSINLGCSKSDLRFQIQTDPRYQEFIKKSSVKDVLGYKMRVARLEDVIKGKVWAYLDERRRASKRQKDLADIFRLIEKYPKLSAGIPDSIKKHIDF